MNNNIIVIIMSIVNKDKIILTDRYFLLCFLSPDLMFGLEIYLWSLTYKNAASYPRINEKNIVTR